MNTCMWKGCKVTYEIIEDSVRLLGIDAGRGDFSNVLSKEKNIELLTFLRLRKELVQYQ